MIKKYSKALLIAIMAMLTAAGVCEAELTAQLTEVEGGVKMQSVAGAIWTKASVGDTLKEGASIRTGSSGVAALRWGDGNGVKIFPLSSVSVSELAATDMGGVKSKISLKSGRLLTRAAKLKTKDSLFEVRTPTALAGVRGTVFDCSIAARSNQVTIAVVEGSLYVSAGDELIIVAAGFETIVEPGANPSAPSTIAPAQLEKLKQEAQSVGATLGKTTKAGENPKKSKPGATIETDEPTENEEAVATEEPGVDPDAEEDIMTDSLDVIYDEVAIQDEIINEASEVNFDSGCGGIQGSIEF